MGGGTAGVQAVVRLVVAAVDTQGVVQVEGDDVQAAAECGLVRLGGESQPKWRRRNMRGKGVSGVMSFLSLTPAGQLRQEHTWAVKSGCARVERSPL